MYENELLSRLPLRRHAVLRYATALTQLPTNCRRLRSRLARLARRRISCAQCCRRRNKKQHSVILAGRMIAAGAAEFIAANAAKEKTPRLCAKGIGGGSRRRVTCGWYAKNLLRVYARMWGGCPPHPPHRRGKLLFPHAGVRPCTLCRLGE